MRAIPVLLCAAVLCGCPHPRPAPDPRAADPDGVRCHDDATGGEPRVYIDLDYSPAVTVPPCTVDAGTTITWRGPETVRDGFAVDFVSASPAGPGAPLHYESNDRSGRHRLSLVADNEPGSYEYHYSVGGRVIDPVIIIRR
jgi:hypothetical protein